MIDFFSLIWGESASVTFQNYSGPLVKRFAHHWLTSRSLPTLSLDPPLVQRTWSKVRSAAPTHSCTASFFSSFSSCLAPLNVDVVWTPCDVTSSAALFCSPAGDGERAAGLPGLLAPVAEGNVAPPPPITTTPSSAASRPIREDLSRGRSLHLSAWSLGGLVIIWSNGGSEPELGCN